MNPIENAWKMLGRALAKVEPQPTKSEELLTQLQIQWVKSESRQSKNSSDR